MKHAITLAYIILMRFSETQFFILVFLKNYCTVHFDLFNYKRLILVLPHKEPKNNGIILNNYSVFGMIIVSQLVYSVHHSWYQTIFKSIFALCTVLSNPVEMYVTQFDERDFFFFVSGIFATRNDIMTFINFTLLDDVQCSVHLSELE